MNAKGSSIKTMNDLVPTSSYVFGLVGSSGNVIPRYEGNAIGHVFITQPGIKWETDYLVGKGKTKTVWTMFAAESTGGVGLAFNTCQFVSVSKDGIFQVKRFSHPHADLIRAVCNHGGTNLFAPRLRRADDARHLERLAKVAMAAGDADYGA